MGIDLFSHNKTAYEAAMDMIARFGKAAVIHPTGTGKSLIAFQLVLDYPKDRVCWLAPSAYIFQTQVRQLLDVMPDFQPEMLSNISFMTYAKLLVHENDLDSLKPDWIILDEFHRAGSQEWGRSVQKLLKLYPDAGVLGLSATNIRYLDNQRDMAEELFDGNIASQMSLSAAVSAGILPAPTYVVSMYAYQEEYQKLQKRVLAFSNPLLKAENQKLLEKLKRALEQSVGLDQTFAKHMPNFHGKYLVFCAGKEHMEEMMQKSLEWFALVDKNPHLYSVAYEDADSSEQYRSFLEDDSPHLKLLFSIDMLNEGIHVKDVDGVILFRPTVSPILYQQQIGRALSSGKKTRPVIFDIVNNFESLCSIDSMYPGSEEAFSCSFGRGGEGKNVLEPFRIIDEILDCRNIFKEIKNNLLAGWEFYYQEAKAYYTKNGNLKIPKSYITSEGLALGTWLLTQKRVYNGKISGTLTKEQILRLEAIGMDFSSRSDQSFERGYEALLEYEKEYGNVDVKASYVAKDGFLLGKWVSNIRRKQKESFGKPLTKEQKKRLDNLGMIWDKAKYQWNRNFQAAKDYYTRYGNLKVPHQYETKDGISLGVWLENQRAVYEGKNPKAVPLTEEQIRQLESIGMEWEKGHDRQWRDRYRCAERYYKTHGNLKVPVTYVTEDGRLLGRWICRQKEQYKKHTLSKERRELLSRIGFEGDMDSYGR